MNILMMTNTYLPHTGGVARSVAWFSEAYENEGHRVLVIAPTFAEGEADDSPVEVFRVPAIQHFNGSDFSVRLPIPGLLTSKLDSFRPDIVHSHHPFLLGDTAVRVAALRDLPLVFTHHTMYEQYTHYVPGDSTAMQRFVMRLATEYANVCDHVIAPSESIARLIHERGVETPISSIPTGIDAAKFAVGDGLAARRRYNIPPSAFVIGHVGRLAEEKNLGFLAEASVKFMDEHPDSHFLLVGMGPYAETFKSIFGREGMLDRLHHPEGYLSGQTLADAYHAMDVFAFASKSETQGMVLAEAMTAGVPVVAIDAPGAREVVRDGDNGRLIMEEDQAQFQVALQWVANSDEARRQTLRDGALSTAQEFSMSRCARKMLDLYSNLTSARRQASLDDSNWAALLRVIEEEWNIWSGLTHAVGDALFGADETEPDASPTKRAV